MKQKRQRPNALSHSLALTAGYLRLRMSMEDVPSSLETGSKIDNCGRFETSKCISCSPPLLLLIAHILGRCFIFSAKLNAIKIPKWYTYKIMMQQVGSK